MTAGVQDLGSGAYGAAVSLPDTLRGRITWDTGEGVPAKASEGINPEILDPATAVWAAATRTLTIAAVSPAPVFTGTDIIMRRGDTLVLPFTGLGSLAGRTKLWFTVKAGTADTDALAVIQIQETVGLVTLNGAPATAGQGSLVVSDATLGNLTVTLAAAASAALAPANALAYDIQTLIGGVIATPTSGRLAIYPDVTEAVS